MMSSIEFMQRLSQAYTFAQSTRAAWYVPANGMIESTLMDAGFQESYAQGPALDLCEKTTHQVLAETAARFPERDALISRHQNIRLACSQLEPQAEHTARG